MVKENSKISHRELINKLDELGIFQVQASRIIALCVKNGTIVPIRMNRVKKKGPRYIIRYVLRRKFD